MSAHTITLVRHGQTLRSKAMIYSGQYDVPLTPVGTVQARLCAARLVGTGIDGVFTSPLSRARDTATVIADAVDARLTVDERLIEVDYGPLEGLTREDGRDRLGPALDDWRADPFGAPLSGMEPLTDALDRAREVTEHALAICEHPALVAHQGILRLVLIALGQLAPEDYFTQRLDEAEPVVIENPAVVAV